MNTEWLDQHISNFIKPTFGGKVVLNKKRSIKSRGDSMVYNHISESNLIELVCAWMLVKERVPASRTLLFAGRDSWLYNILCEIDGERKHIFRPDISTSVSYIVAEDYTKTVLVDTGYKGTCPINMRIPDFLLTAYNPVYSGACDTLEYAKILYKHLISPQHNSSGLAGHMESSPKYWDAGQIKEDTDSNTTYGFLGLYTWWRTRCKATGRELAGKELEVELLNSWRCNKLNMREAVAHIDRVRSAKTLEITQQYSSVPIAQAALDLSATLFYRYTDPQWMEKTMEIFQKTYLPSAMKMREVLGDESFYLRG